MSFCDRQGIPDFLLRADVEDSENPHRVDLEDSENLSCVDRDDFGERLLRRMRRLGMTFKTAVSRIPGRKNRQPIRDDGDSPERHTIASENESFEGDVEMLRNYSFIRGSDDGQSLDMHRLVQLATQEWLELEKQTERWKGRVLRKLWSAAPDSWENVEDRDTLRAIFPHARRVVEMGPPDEDGNIFGLWAKVSLNTVWWGARSGQYRVEDAEKLLDQLLAAEKKRLGADHERTMTLLELKAETVAMQGRWQEAEKLLLELLELKKRKFGGHDPGTVDTMQDLGGILRESGRFKEAEELLVHVLETRKRRFWENEELTLDTTIELGETLRMGGRLKEAEELLVQAAAKAKATLGPSHDATLNSETALALTYTDQGRLAEAEELLARVLEGFEKKYGEDDASAAYARSDLARVYWRRNRPADAQRLIRRGVEALKRTVGEQHPDVQDFIRELAEWESETRKEEASEANS